MRWQSRGATLLELMIAIAVVAVALAMAVPNFARMVADNRVASASDSLVNTFQYARNMALRGEQPVTVCPVASAGATTCDSAWDDDWSVIVPAAASSSTLMVLASNRVGAGGVTVTGNAATPGPIVFTPRGLVTGLPAGGSEIFAVCGARGAAHAGAVMLNSAGYVEATATLGQDPNGAALSCPNG
ncbi:MAG TPA: GspH/FimT family pseudopilin [Rhodanobacteraceae bacterium]|nr:GspH/FimT family pseudopilin [Rhodanobacteraceae bacterium]